MESASFLDSLRAHVGSAHVLTDADALQPYLKDWRGMYHSQALAVVRPGSKQEVVHIVRACAAAGVSLVAQGGNTGLVGGSVAQGGIILSLTRMNFVRDVDRLNATMTVEAGCVLKSVQDTAQLNDYLFPLSLASEGSCTIGGVLSTNAGGTAVLRYGTMRDCVLGLEVVLADGRVWNGLNRLRKDNTGYDLKHLFMGAEGTLGVITAAVLKLFPVPRQRVTAFIGTHTPQQALALFHELRQDAGDHLTAFEYMQDTGLQMVLRHVGGARAPFSTAYASYALIELSSPDASLPLQAQMQVYLANALEQDLIFNAVIASSEAQAQALWLLRESLSDTQKLEGGSIKHDVSVPVSSVAQFIVEATALCEVALDGVRVVAFGHFGDGNIHFNLSQPKAMETAVFLARWQDFNDLVHDLVARLGGSISAEHGIGLLKRHELLRYKDPVAIQMMQTIKHALDPKNLMNPGKIWPIS